MVNHERSLIPGWYGKIPSLGDFTSRRLPTSFINSWDLWLQHAMATSREQLGERWLDLYLTGPIWRFTLMPQVCDDNMWAGILMPSVDKVGRYFPLTFTIQIEPIPRMMSAIFSAQNWYADLEQVALNSLNIQALPDDIDQCLTQHPFPAPYLKEQSIPEQELATWWQKKSLVATNVHNTLSLPSADLLNQLFDTTAKDLLFSSGLGKSIWWKVSSEDATTQLHCFAGLPPDAYFANLLQNDAQ